MNASAAPMKWRGEDECGHDARQGHKALIQLAPRVGHGDAENDQRQQPADGRDEDVQKAIGDVHQDAGRDRLHVYLL